MRYLPIFKTLLRIYILAKLEGMKMMARWLVGLQSDAISAKKCFNMLNTVISSKGDLLEENKPNTAERAWLRLAAGCAMLKICEQKGVGDEYTVEQYYTLSQLISHGSSQAGMIIFKGLGVSCGGPLGSFGVL